MLFIPWITDVFFLFPIKSFLLAFQEDTKSWAKDQDAEIPLPILITSWHISFDLLCYHCVINTCIERSCIKSSMTTRSRKVTSCETLFVQPGEEKAPEKPYGNFQHLKGATRGLEKDFWKEHVVIREEGNGFKLKDGKFRLDVRKKFYTVAAMRHWQGLPEKLPHFWKCSRPRWMMNLV